MPVSLSASLCLICIRTRVVKETGIINSILPLEAAPKMRASENGGKKRLRGVERPEQEASFLCRTDGVSRAGRSLPGRRPATLDRAAVLAGCVPRASVAARFGGDHRNSRQRELVRRKTADSRQPAATPARRAATLDRAAVLAGCVPRASVAVRFGGDHRNSRQRELVRRKTADGRQPAATPARRAALFVRGTLR